MFSYFDRRFQNKCRNIMYLEALKRSREALQLLCFEKRTIKTFSIPYCWYKLRDEFCQKIVSCLTCCSVLTFSLKLQGHFWCPWWLWKAKRYGYNFYFLTRGKYGWVQCVLSDTRWNLKSVRKFYRPLLTFTFTYYCWHLSSKMY